MKVRKHYGLRENKSRLERMAGFGLEQLNRPP